MHLSIFSRSTVDPFFLPHPFGFVCRFRHSAALYSYLGADEPWVDDGRPFSNEFYDNEVTGITTGVLLVNSDDISITGE